MDRRVHGIAELPLDLLVADRQVVDVASHIFHLLRHCEVPEERHGVAERGDHDENDDFGP